MMVRIPKDVFSGFAQWMALTPPWAAQFQVILDEHMGEWCDFHDIDTFEELVGQIGSRRVTTLKDHAFMDFLSREIDHGNAVDLYLRGRGGSEKKTAKDYLAGCRTSVIGLYEVSAVRPGKSFMARDLLTEADPIRVQERAATRTLRNGEQGAMRVVKMPKASILGGDILCLPPECIGELVDKIVGCATTSVAETTHDLLKGIPSELHRDLSILTTLKFCAPIFSEAWLKHTVATEFQSNWNWTLPKTIIGL